MGYNASGVDVDRYNRYYSRNARAQRLRDWRASIGSARVNAARRSNEFGAAREFGAPAYGGPGSLGAPAYGGPGSLGGGGAGRGGGGVGSGG